MEYDIDLSQVRELSARLSMMAGNAGDEAQHEATMQAAEYIKRQLEKTVTTWKHQVDFEIYEPGRTRRGEFAFAISTEDDVWNMLDQGTKPHKIEPKNEGYPLRFMAGGFRAKTRARVFGSYNGAGGREQVRAMFVKHPGTAARDWSGTSVRLFADDAARLALKYFNQAIDKIFSASGWSSRRGSLR